MLAKIKIAMHPRAVNVDPNRINFSALNIATKRSLKFALVTKKLIPINCIITKSVKLPCMLVMMTVGAPKTNTRSPPKVKE